MREHSLETESFNLSEILECKIEKSVNEHFTAMISGYISDAEEERLRKESAYAPLHINACSETGKIYSIFKGFLCNMSIEYNGGLKKLTLCAKSNTVKLDETDRVRTFQGQDQTYREIVETIISSDSGTQVIYTEGKETDTKGLIVQYRETDWEFIKRMAKEAGTVIVPDCTNDYICFYFGIPRKNKNAVLETSEYCVKRYEDCYGQEQEEIWVVSRDNAELCEPVSFLGNRYLIYSLTIELVRNELIYRYCLKTQEGFKRRGRGNDKIMGASIFGTVSQVKEDMVRIRVKGDGDFHYGKSLWFPYATVYSSPDGTGWYCMPEKGDQIRLQFPDSDERNAYVINAVHIEDTRGLRKDPDEKSFRTKYDKEIRLTPSRILITNHDGLSITLDDKKGIIIKSDQEVAIISENTLNIRSRGNVEIEADQGVYLMENQNLLMIRNGIKEKAMRIEHS